MGAPILVDASENTNPIDIALKELDARNTADNDQKNIARRNFPRYSIKMANLSSIFFF